MCGICGIYRRDGKPVSRESVQRMSEVLEHRGPDGAGSLVAGEIGLGHRRLSIIDLEGGAQPLSNEDGSVNIIFNGEIYNYLELKEELVDLGHRFKTVSDTEVIVHAYEQWGIDCIRRFNGIFAFAVWDGLRRRLFLARDHLGVKPLYFIEQGSQLLFASEIKALLTDSECPREVDLTSLGQLFSLRYVPSPRTLFRNIRKLPSAHYLIADKDGIQIKSYWNSLPELTTESSEERLVEEYQELLADAVRLQMRSDVPVGLFLSGGVDSGALLGIMSALSSRPVHTFTIGFEDGERSNELHDARELARSFSADHAEMVITAQDYERYFDRYISDLEEPVGNETAAAFYFVSRLARDQVKVALTGQGADEPWAGYHRHLGIKISEDYSRLPQALTQRFLAPAILSLTRNERLTRGARSLGERDMLTRLIRIYSFYSKEMKVRLFKPWLLEHISSDGIEAKQALAPLQSRVQDRDPLTQMLYLDTRTNLPDDLLMVSDKMAMANSLEARVPYLDCRLVEFIEALPPGLKLRRFSGKYLHKKALKKWLPKKVVYRRKKGFANPIDQWLRAGLYRYVIEMLLSETSIIHRYFNQDYVRELIAAHKAGNAYHLRHIYLLLSFEMWHRQYLR